MSILDQLEMHRGVLHQCVMTKQHQRCDFRLGSLFRQFGHVFDTNDIYYSRATYTFLQTQGLLRISKFYLMNISEHFEMSSSKNFARNMRHEKGCS